MANVVNLFDYKIKRALQKGQKNTPRANVAELYENLTIQQLLYQIALFEAREREHNGLS